MYTSWIPRPTFSFKFHKWLSFIIIPWIQQKHQPKIGTDTPVAHPRHHCTRSLPHYQPRESVTSENIAPTHDVTPQTTWPRHRPLSPQCLQPAFLSYWQVGPDSFRFSSCSIRDFVTSHELDIYLMDSLSRSPWSSWTPWCLPQCIALSSHIWKEIW